MKQGYFTNSIVQFIENQKFENIPSLVIQRAKLSIIDSMAVTILGAKHQAIALAINHIKKQGGLPICTVIGHSFKMPPLFAAWLNGMSGHVLDFEMMWNPPCHPCSSILPALWAICEMQPVSGKQFLTAYVIGLEVLARLLLLKGKNVPKIFHPQAIEGQIGCAAASSKLLGLKKNNLCYAVGIAASTCAGLMANAGSMTKCLHSGLGAMSGLQAALLAQDGFTANPAIFDCEPGFFQAFFSNITHEQLCEQLVKNIGHPFWLEDQNFALKNYPCQYGIHFAIEAALRMRESKQIDSKTIISIELEFPVMPYISRKHLETPLDGKFSLEYLIASAFLDGNIEESTFQETMMNRPLIKKLMSCITIHFNPQLIPSFEEMSGLLKVTISDGSTFQEVCMQPEGHWTHPITQDLIWTKFHRILSLSYQNSWIENLFDNLSNIEKIPDLAKVNKPLA